MLAHTLLPLIGANTLSPRAIASLDGEWTLTMDDSSRKINVPGSWQAQIPELRAYTGRAVYTREFDLPEAWRSKRVFVRFGAVDYLAEVYVNGQKLGEHEGGYTPFEFEINDVARFGEANTIEVRVADPGPGKPVGDLRFEDIPHGKQMWYGNASGLWQSVTLEARYSAYIERIVVDPDVDASTAARFCVRLVGACSGKVRVRVNAPDGAGEVPEVMVDIKAGDSESTFTIPVPTPALWSPESPALYEARVELIEGDEVFDALGTTFGMRKIEAKDGQILLNGKPVFLAGVLDQDFYPGTEYGVPSDEYLRDQFLQAKHLGLNLMRCHIKIPDPRYLEWCDRLGLLVWYELPNWIELTDNAKRRGKETLKAALERDHNHPSLVIVSVINESWGIDLHKPENRAWLLEMYDFTKGLEPDRLIVDNSPCSDASHVKTDIEDFHIYMSIPDQADEFRRWIEEFAGHPGYTFIDAQRRGFEPLMLSEFGNWGLPRVSKLRECYGGDPWWFDPTYELSGAPDLRGSEDRFKEQRLAFVFGDVDGLADAYQDQEWMALKFQIEEMRRYPSIAGYVITEFTDIHWESNGLLDYCRNPKTFHDLMHTVQDPDIVFARTDAANYVSGETIRAELYISHFSQRSLEGARIEWMIEGTSDSGSEAVQAVEPGYAGAAAKIELRAPDVDSPQRMRLAMRLVSEDGSVVAANCHQFVVFAAAQPPIPDDVIVSDKLDDTTLALIREGANAVICIEKPEALQALGDVEAVDRGATARSGAWCSSLIWFKDSPAFDGSPVPRTTDLSMEAISPSCVFEGVPFDSWEKDVLSGIFVGWIHKPAAVILQARIGEGKVVITTLPVVSACENDPMARCLLASLAGYVSSDKCQPGLELGSDQR